MRVYSYNPVELVYLYPPVEALPRMRAQHAWRELRLKTFEFQRIYALLATAYSRRANLIKERKREHLFSFWSHRLLGFSGTHLNEWTLWYSLYEVRFFLCKLDSRC